MCKVLRKHVFSFLCFIKSFLKDYAGVSAACPFPNTCLHFQKAIFLPPLCSSASVNISAEGIRPRQYSPSPKRLTAQPPETPPTGCLTPSPQPRKASLFLLHSFAPTTHFQTALLAMCTISHAKPPTHQLISIEVNLTLVRLLQTHHNCSAPLLSITQLTQVQLWHITKSGTSVHT